VTLFYATDEEQAAAAAERLISAAGFEPVKAGGLDGALRIEMGGNCTSTADWTGSCWTPTKPTQR